MKKNILFCMLFMLLASAFYAQEEVDLSQSISDGNCYALYSWMQKQSDKSSYQYTQVKKVVDDYRKVNSFTKRYHNGKMENIVNTVPQDIKLMVFSSSEETLPELVKYLAAKGSGASDFLTVKNFHDWICNNISYDAEMFFSGKIENQDYESVLKARKAVCSGYANLLKKMCELSNIECKVIHGFSKGFNYTGKVGDAPDHDWNSVKIDGKWYLVDATWDAGRLDGKTFIKQYSTEYLFLESFAFSFTHLAEENSEQYYAPCKTKEQFQNEPRLTGKFFESNFSYSENMPFDLVKITYPKIAELSYLSSSYLPVVEMKNSSTGEKVNTIWVENSGAKLKMELDVPDSDEYTVTIREYDKKNKKPKREFLAGEFEDAQKKINECLDEGTLQFEDASYFLDSYFKVEENNKYYFREDLFDVKRYVSLKKVFEVLNIPSGDELYSFKVKADADYKGYGSKEKYPYVHDEVYEVKETFLVSPKKAILSDDKEVKFSLKTKDFLYVVLVDSDENIPFVKNNKTGAWELSRKVEGREVTISASRDKRSYIPLFTFNNDMASGSSSQNASAEK